MPATPRDLAAGVGLSGADHRGVSADINPPLGDGARAKIDVRGDAIRSLLRRLARQRVEGPPPPATAEGAGVIRLSKPNDRSLYRCGRMSFYEVLIRRYSLLGRFRLTERVGRTVMLLTVVEACAVV
jgi:hypothetical protein